MGGIFSPNNTSLAKGRDRDLLQINPDTGELFKGLYDQKEFLRKQQEQKDKDAELNRKNVKELTARKLKQGQLSEFFDFGRRDPKPPGSGFKPFRSATTQRRSFGDRGGF